MTQRRHESPELGSASRRMMRGLVVRASEGDTEAIEQLVELQAAVTEALGQAVAGAREGAGYSWAELAPLLGTTRQAAQQRFGKATPLQLWFSVCGLRFGTERAAKLHQAKCTDCEAAA